MRESFPKTEPKLMRAVRGKETEPSGNYIDHSDGTVTDASTGLMWQKYTAPGAYTWQQALSYCENLTLAGYSDWRLPNKKELVSLVDYSTSNPAINTTFFPDTVFGNTSMYWSSTTFTGDSSRAWGVEFEKGRSRFLLNKGASRYVRAVRGGDCVLDVDGDSVPDDVDNCTNNYNPDQLDTFPPQGNGIGDACDCRADFDGDGDVDAKDAMSFLKDFARSSLNRPCTNKAPCKGDFYCDGAVDAKDALLFVEEYGGSKVKKFCSAYNRQTPWCRY